MLWVAKTDLASRQGHAYNGRFLNIADPWTDKRLLNWKGYSDNRYFDAEGRSVPAETAGARMVEMIPLALYGLDNPKIPMLLVDFRDTLNPKKREMSRRVLEDVTGTCCPPAIYGTSSVAQCSTSFGRRGWTYSRGRNVSHQNYCCLERLSHPRRDQIDGRLERFRQPSGKRPCC